MYELEANVMAAKVPMTLFCERGASRNSEGAVMTTLEKWENF